MKHNNVQKTTESYLMELKEYGNGEFTSNSEYHNNQTNMEYVHTVCGESFNRTPANFKKNQSCPHCNKRNGAKERAKKGKLEKWTPEIFNTKMKEKFDGVFEVIGEYKNADTKIKFKHLECGRTFSAPPTRVLNGYHGCTHCKHEEKFGKQRKTQEDFEKELEEKHPGMFKVLGKYISTGESIKVQCKICNHVWNPKAGHLVHDTYNTDCPNCDIMKKRLFPTEEDFEFFVRVETAYDYKVIKHLSPVAATVKHICGHEYNVTHRAFKKGSRCPKCAPLKQRLFQTKEEFIEFFNDNNDNGDYVLNKIDDSVFVNITHKCGHTYDIEQRRYAYGDRCIKCNTRRNSKGSRRISEFLESCNLDYELEFKDNRCKSKRSLPFDFALQIDDTKKLLIEFDGEGHFKPTFGADESEKENNYKMCKMRDGIKTLFCETFNDEYELLRISYKELNNIELILFNKLQKLKMI